jgi:hypothetical protein
MTRLSALCATALASAVTLSIIGAAAQTNRAPELLPIGRILLQEALAAESAGPPRVEAEDWQPTSIPAAWFPLPSCAFPAGLCGAVDRNGVAVVAPIYDWVGLFRQGRAIVRSGRLYGLIDTTGRVIAPAAYDDVEVFSHDLLRIVRDGRTGLIDFAGRVVVEPRYDRIGWLAPDVLWLGVSVPTAAPLQPDSWPDASHRFIPGTDRSSLPLSSSFLFHLRGKATLIHRDGSVVRDFPHIEVRLFDAARGLAWARTEALWGLTKPDGEWLLDPRFEDVRPLSGGLAAVELGGRWGYVDGDGRVVISPRFDGPGEFVAGQLGRQTDRRRQQGLIDRNGQWVVEPRYDSLSFRPALLADGGRWLAQLGSDWDVLDDVGTLTAHIQGPLDQAPMPCADGRFRGLRNKAWILFDSKGLALVPPEGRLDFADCDARLRVRAGGRVGVVDAAMHWIVPPRFEAIMPLPDRDGRMLAKIDGKQGVMGADGRWIIAPVYDELKDFAAGTIVAGRDGMYGVLRVDGAWLIEPTFEDLRRLADDRYAARLDGKYGVLLADGHWLIEPSFEDAKPLADNRIVARSGGLNGVYDTEAKAWVVEPRSGLMCGFQGRYAIGITDRLRTLYDVRAGDILIGPSYNRIWLNFAAGLIAVRVGDRWGYADVSGNLVIPAQFRTAGMFSRGIAWADREGRLCPINRRGQWVEGIPCVDLDPRELDPNWLPRPLCGD